MFVLTLRDNRKCSSPFPVPHALHVGAFQQTLRSLHVPLPRCVVEWGPPLRIHAIRVSPHRDAEPDNPRVPLPHHHVDRRPPIGVHRIHV